MHVLLRTIGKADGALKEDGMLKEGMLERVKYLKEGKVSSAGRLCVREGNVEGKEDIKRRKY
jgi:hypothetical protein